MRDVDNEVPPESGRRHKRVAFRAPVLVSHGVIETELDCVDVSENGLCVEGDWLWPEGSVVALRVVLGERTAVARGKVVRAEGTRMGLELTFQGPTFQRLLSMLYRCGQRAQPSERRQSA